MKKALHVQVENVVSLVLRAGVLISFAIVVVGGAMYLGQHRGEAVSFQDFVGAQSDLKTIPAIVERALRFRSDALIQLGLLVLISTPIARVLMSAVGFGIDGDRLYMTVSSIVLAVLLFGLFHAI